MIKINAIENYLKENEIKKTPAYIDDKQNSKPMWVIQQEINDYARLHK